MHIPSDLHELTDPRVEERLIGTVEAIEPATAVRPLLLGQPVDPADGEIETASREVDRFHEYENSVRGSRPQLALA